MARIRTIKPDFFKNDLLADIPMSGRILFIGLWTLADCEGRLEDRPKRIKAELFPYDSVDINDLLSRLQSAGFIIRYSASGGQTTETEVGELKVIQIVNFRKHQRITGTEADSQSELPPPEEGSIEETPRKHFGNTLETPRTTGKEGKGRERKGKEGDVFIPPSCDEVVQYFVQNGYSEEVGQKAFKYYNEASWKDSKGSKVKNWKQKMIAVWFKEENQKEKSCAKKEKGKTEELFNQHERITEANERRYGAGKGPVSIVDLL